MNISKGTWEVDTKKESGGYYIACRAKDGEGESVAFAFPMPEDETLANAHLIAAAPDMYEALKDICSNYQRIEFIKAEWLEALAKAEGKQ